jgi:WD40 repeat protein
MTGTRYAAYDQYGFRHLPQHLARGNQLGRLRDLLFDFEWLSAKLGATDPASLIVDYDLLPGDTDLCLIQEALRLSAPVLAGDKNQLAGHLWGRLQGYRALEIQALLAQARETPSPPWLRPLTASLTPPGGPLVRTFHTELVVARDPCLAITADGRFVLSASGGRVILWEVASGEQACNFSGDWTTVSAVAMTPDKRLAVAATDAAGEDGASVRIWEIKTGEEVFAWHYSKGPSTPDADIQDLAITHDGRLVFVAFYEGHSVEVWDVRAARSVHVTGEWRKYRRVVVTENGKVALTTSYSEDGTRVSVWNVDTSASRTLHLYPYGISDIAITRDGKLAVWKGDDNTVQVWDREADPEFRALYGHLHPVSAVAVTDQDRRIISADSGGTILVWDLEAREPIHTLRGHSAPVARLAVTPMGDRVFSASRNGILHVWDLGRNRAAPDVRSHADRINAVAITPEGSLALSASADRAIKVWDVGTGWQIHTLTGHIREVNAVAVTPDGRRAVSGSEDATVKVWNLVTGREVRTLRGHLDGVWDVAITADGRTVLSAAGHTIKVWNADSGRESRTLEPDPKWSIRVRTVTVTADGRMAFASANQCVTAWDLATGESRLIGSAVESGQFATTSDGRLALFQSRSKLALAMSDAHPGPLVWDVSTNQLLGKLSGHTDWIRSVALTPEGRFAVSLSDDGTLKLWEIATQKEIAAYNPGLALSCCTVAANGSTTILAGDAAGHLHWLSLEGGDTDDA